MSKFFKKIIIATLFVFLAVGCQKASNQQSANHKTADSGQLTADQSVSGKREAVSELAQKEIKFTYLVVGVDNTVKEFATLDKITALQFLKSKFKVETKTFSGVGEFVTVINGIKETSGKNFWALYVNGKQAKVGAGDYVLQEGDKVEWKLEEIK